MLDYQAIAALSAVIETQSFQAAADKLFITQSAVSQRIKGLEQFYGEPVLIRTQPYRPTTLGLSLLGHYKRVCLLEDALQTTLTNAASIPRVSISISRDTLETWFVTVLDKIKKIMPLTVDIIADDQEQTLTYLQKGLVSACASTVTKPLSGLPAFLVNEPGINSGFMIAQVTAAALASENKSLAHPASVDSLPTSANQEDHVSMGTFAARRLLPMCENTAGIVAIELLAACQGIDFLRPLTTSVPLEAIHKRLREKVSFYASDRFFAPDIAAAKLLVQSGVIRW